MPHIGIITYNYRHLKTEQILEELFRKDVKEKTIEYMVKLRKYIFNINCLLLIPIPTSVKIKEITAEKWQ